MGDFRQLSSNVLASPQIGLNEVAEAIEQGVTLIINNRPDGESPDQIGGCEIEAAALQGGINYLAIPIGPSGFNESQVVAMQEALTACTGKALAYCRSGTRSTFLWSLAESRAGSDPDEIAKSAAQVGYDVSPIRAAMDALFAQNPT